MNDSKLKIRIQIQQPQQAIEQVYPDLPEPEMKYEQSLDWKKISIVILLLLAAMALIGYLFFGTNKQEIRLNEAGPVSGQPLSVQETIPGHEVTEMPQSTSSVTQPKPPAFVNKPLVIPRKKPQAAASPSQSKSERISDHPQVLGAREALPSPNTETY